MTTSMRVGTRTPHLPEGDEMLHRDFVWGTLCPSLAIREGRLAWLFDRCINILYLLCPELIVVYLEVKFHYKNGLKIKKGSSKLEE